MPIYNNALTQRPANRLAYQGSIGPVPRNESYDMPVNQLIVRNK